TLHNIQSLAGHITLPRRRFSAHESIPSAFNMVYLVTAPVPF
ncbi:hypothetical protein HMPREF1590_00850, partial [Escherichia coli 113302]